VLLFPAQSDHCLEHDSADRARTASRPE
jgi:hypothetical protein